MRDEEEFESHKQLTLAVLDRLMRAGWILESGHSSKRVGVLWTTDEVKKAETLRKLLQELGKPPLMDAELLCLATLVEDVPLPPPQSG